MQNFPAFAEFGELLEFMCNQYKSSYSHEEIQKQSADFSFSSSIRSSLDVKAKTTITASSRA